MTEAVLITSKKQVETIKLHVGEYELTSQSFIRYLGVIIDTRSSFKQPAEHASSKASGVRTAVSRLMLNVGGPKQRRRALPSSVIRSVITYGIAIWADTLLMQESRWKVASVYRLSVPRVASAYRTVSEDAACVITAMLPIEVLAVERRSTYRQKRSTKLSSVEVDVCLNRQHGEVNYYLTQMVSGHGSFREYLHKFKYEDFSRYPTHIEVDKNADHVFFTCPRFSEIRITCESDLGRKLLPGNLLEVMVSTQATSNFAAELMKELRSEERAGLQNRRRS
ncbi:uncharacterized protein LOC107045593 [Diachasma alloeum]|uniref:uncharacterized protein LOC107045593 n=1 Tax=Diachasma alloeum TaxID=454923 RepID=UPI00073819B3|nr:uncharacterized protein LOC107045593 [Diachasma alloeum]